jgi:hypothetical protein
VPTAVLERRSTRGVLSGVTGVLVTGFVFAAMTLSGLAVAQPATAADSTAVTVSASDYDDDAANSPFPGLKMTVSQTQGLVSQGIEISWTGGRKSTPPTQQTGGEDFLQFAQCWGDDPRHPGQPDRSTCQYGAFLTPGATRDGNRADGTIAPEDEEHSTAARGALDPAYTAIPFRSATGETIAAVKNGEKITPAVDVNTNPFFTQYTSNEIPWAGSGSDGSGSTKFEVQTVVQAQGLGCGSRVTEADGSVRGASCWLVAIPRGTADAGETAITKSGLNWDTWKHHLAVKLDFRPIGLNCSIGAAERQVAGSELLSTAVASWQPTLCSAQGGSVYTLITGTESDALAASNRAEEASPLALTSYPYAGEAQDALVYAPVGLTAVTVAFAIDRFPKADGSVPPEIAAKARLPFTSLNLTPRLVAKLLTASYQDSLPPAADRTHLAANARNLAFDPDFLLVNDPEWSQQAIAGIGVSDMLIPQGRSDAASAVWAYVMADADARDFLAGKADPWGMVVNKWSSTDAEVNPTGTGLVFPRDSFPKADPTEVAATPDGPAAINLVTWRPYTNDLDTSGYLALRGDGQVLGGWDAFSSPPRYSKTPRDLPGAQGVLALTDAAAAEKYQVVTASLLNGAGRYVAPGSASIEAAAAAMTASPTQPQVYGLNPAAPETAAAVSAYPLTMPVYAAANPSLKDAALRKSYSDFIRYAAGDGQTPGVGIGQLPDGYAPLPAGWRQQALSAAEVLEQGFTPQSPTDQPAGANGQIVPSVAGGGGSIGRGSSSAAGQSAPAAPVAPAGPAASGPEAAALVGTDTPDDPDVSVVAATLPASLLAGLVSAAAVLIIPRLPRRT